MILVMIKSLLLFSCILAPVQPSTDSGHGREGPAPDAAQRAQTHEQADELPIGCARTGRQDAGLVRRLRSRSLVQPGVKPRHALLEVVDTSVVRLGE